VEVTQLSCTQCETVILGRFEPCRFCNLPAESLHFLETFIRNRGNVKEMERETGISYWTIRSRLNELIDELGLAPQPDAAHQKAQRRDILARLKKGELDVTEASKLLEKL
jgi:hypothetical protein